MNALTAVMGWVPLIVFWTMKINLAELPTWSIALPAFATGVFISVVINK